MQPERPPDSSNGLNRNPKNAKAVSGTHCAEEAAERTGNLSRRAALHGTTFVRPIKNSSTTHIQGSERFFQNTTGGNEEMMT